MAQRRRPSQSEHQLKTP